jgi:hypothetical protein
MDGINEMDGNDEGVAVGSCDIDGDTDGAGVLKVGTWLTLGCSDGLSEGKSVGDALGREVG